MPVNADKVRRWPMKRKEPTTQPAEAQGPTDPLAPAPEPSRGPSGRMAKTFLKGAIGGALGAGAAIMLGGPIGIANAGVAAQLGAGAAFAMTPSDEEERQEIEAAPTKKQKTEGYDYDYDYQYQSQSDALLAQERAERASRKRQFQEQKERDEDIRRSTEELPLSRLTPRCIVSVLH